MKFYALPHLQKFVWNDSKASTRKVDRRTGRTDKLERAKEQIIKQQKVISAILTAAKKR